MTSSHWHPSTALGPLVRSLGAGHAGTIDVPMESFPDVTAGRYAQRFLRTRDSSRPFLLFCSFPGPHRPWLVTDEFGIRYAPGEIRLWPNRHDDFDGKPINQKKVRLTDGLMADAVGRCWKVPVGRFASHGDAQDTARDQQGATWRVKGIV